MERSDSVSNFKEIDSKQDKTELTVVSRETAIAEISQPTDSCKASPKWAQIKLVLMGLLGLTAIGAISGYLWRYIQIHREADDAHVMGTINPVNARVSGTVKQVLVSSEQLVKRGSVLIKLDRSDYLDSYKRSRKAIIKGREKVKLTREKMRSSHAAFLESNKKLQQAQTELSPKLKNFQITIADIFSQKIDVLESHEIISAVKEFKSDAINSLKRETEIKKRQSEEATQQYKEAREAVRKAEIEMKNAQYHLSNSNITASADGKVGSKAVRTGQKVSTGQTLMSLIQLRPWIIANFQQDELENMQPGQSAEIKIGTFPNRTFTGRVEKISPVTGAKFASFVSKNIIDKKSITNKHNKNHKITPRVPVQIVFDPKSLKGYESKITPGMEAEVTVEVR
jgi:membrane fusion protein, multidrug efflux system